MTRPFVLNITNYFVLLTLVLICTRYLIINYYSVSRFKRQTRSQKGMVQAYEVFDKKFLRHEDILGSRSSVAQIFYSEDLILALDQLLQTKASNYSGPNFFKFDGLKTYIMPNETLHLSFVGDSRVRQLFILFLMALPNYDRIGDSAFVFDRSSNHSILGENIGYSKLQRVLVSFYWQPLLDLDDNRLQMSDFFGMWLNHERSGNSVKVKTPHPDVLIIGISIHNMITRNGISESDYFKNLKKLVPILQEISKNGQVVWLSQYTALDLLSPTGTNRAFIHEYKIWQYNQRANMILKDGRIPIWDSGSPILDEYKRSCSLNARIEGTYGANWFYFECDDPLHPGFSALTGLMQLLYNIILPKSPRGAEVVPNNLFMTKNQSLTKY